MAKQSKFFSSFIETKPKAPIQEEIKQTVVTLHNAPMGNITSGYTGKFDGGFQTIIDNEKVSAPNVKELLNCVQELQTEGVTEDRAYKNAFAAFKLIGLTKESLLNTANHYIEIINNVYAEFKDTIISKLQTDIANIDERKNQIIQEIQKLQSESNDLSTTRGEKFQELTNIKCEIDGSYNKNKTYFDSILIKIQNYL